MIVNSEPMTVCLPTKVYRAVKEVDNSIPNTEPFEHVTLEIEADKAKEVSVERHRRYYFLIIKTAFLVCRQSIFVCNFGMKMYTPKPITAPLFFLEKLSSYINVANNFGQTVKS